MASSYRGIYVQRYSNGQIHNVQVVAPGGSSIGLSPFDYLAIGIEPPMEKLPNAEDYFARLNNP